MIYALKEIFPDLIMKSERNLHIFSKLENPIPELPERINHHLKL